MVLPKQGMISYVGELSVPYHPIRMRFAQFVRRKTATDPPVCVEPSAVVAQWPALYRYPSGLSDAQRACVPTASVSLSASEVFHLALIGGHSV